MELSEHYILYSDIKALEPIHIGYRHPIGTFHPTKKYITAKALRGMLGNYLHEEHIDEFNATKISDDEEPIFLFKPAFPFDQAETLHVPGDIKWCKLCQRAIFNKNNICLEDGHEGKRASGLVKTTSLKEWILDRPKINTSINTKCPIYPPTLTSYPAEVENKKAPYHIESILPGTIFKFRMIVPKDYLNNIRKWLMEAGIFYGVGGFRTRGYGSIKFDNFRYERIEDYIVRRAKELGNKPLKLVINSPTLIVINKKSYIGFGKEFQNEMSKIINKKIIINGCYYGQTEIKGWIYKGKYRISDIIQAIDSGSTCEVQGLSPEDAAKIEITGVGYWNHIFGDVYFYTRG